MKLGFCLCVAGLVVAGPVGATALELGVEAWLADDDATALPALAQAATAGDRDAMLLLGALELRGLPSKAEMALTEAERLALYRAPDADGLPWLDVALTGQDADIAAPLIAFFRADHGQKPMADLIRLGEIGIAGKMALSLVAQDPAALTAVEASAPMPDPLRPWAWIAAANVLSQSPNDPTARALIAEAAAAPDGLMRRVFLSYGGDRALGLDPATPDSDLNRLLREGEAYSLIETWSPDMAAAMEPVLLAAPETALLGQLCAATCPEDAGGCTRALYGAAGGIFGMVALHSPLERVIPEDRYHMSPRALADLRRLAAEAPRTRIQPGPGVTCGFALLDAAPEPR